MNFEHNDKVRDLLGRLEGFMDEYIYPNEELCQQQIAGMGDDWAPIPIVESLKPKAHEAGLWNLFLPESELGAGLTNLEYAPLCEVMGRVYWASEVFNCSAPDTGNMETLERYGTEEQKREWLDPLLAGEIRSCFAMTEPGVASSDARNICATILRDGDEYVINGLKFPTHRMAMAKSCSKTSGYRSPTSCLVKAVDSRSPRAGSVRAASTTACA
jgi:acyl-CoA dehydrogenase